MSKARCLAIASACLLAGAAALADDIRPEARTHADARPMADEQCIEKCDADSDRCMQEAEADAGKIQVCDDKYSECLQSCEGG